MPDLADSISDKPAGASPVAPGTLAKGVPFDPARHIPRTNTKTGAWMPKGGRKAKPASHFSGSTSSQQANTGAAQLELSGHSSASPAGSLGASVTADDLIPLADAAKPSEAPADVKATTPAAAGTPAKSADVGPGESMAGAPSAPKGPVDKASYETAGELSARVTYAIMGALIKNHKKATAIGDEHTAIKSAFAAFFEHRGVVFNKTACLVLILISYAMGDMRREEVTALVKGIFSKKKPEQTAINVTATVVSQTPISTPAATTPADSEPKTHGKLF